MLKDIKVLELASVLAGPSVGQFFAEMGAEVIKVENTHTHGDVTRSWKTAGEETDDRSAYFCSVNWGKRSMGLDLAKNEGRKILHQLCAQSDIVLVSFKPGDEFKFEADYESLKKINPSVIYGAITGYGSDNDRVGYDAVVQAESGFMDLNGEPDGVPLKMPVALIDVLAAHQLKEGILLALLQRERTKVGMRIEVSLIQTGITSLSNQATNWLVAGQVPKRMGSAHPNIAPYGDSFLTKDGKRILLAVGSDKQFTDLCKILNHIEWKDDLRFTNNQSRVKNRNVLNNLLNGSIAQIHSETLLQEIHWKKIPAGIIQNVKEVLEGNDAREILLGNNEIKGVRNFIGQGFARPHVLPPPHYGEHSSSILIEKLGFSSKEAFSMLEKSIISGK
ncbi:MAG: CoA transferase [Flammeovirgaceae bacterium]|nr:CoA transferase [Flammeovirgaceae bacterium]